MNAAGSSGGNDRPLMAAGQAERSGEDQNQRNDQCELAADEVARILRDGAAAALVEDRRDERSA